MGRLRVLSGREVCRILRQHGFVEVRRRGSHIVMPNAIEHATGAWVTRLPITAERVARALGLVT